MEQRRQTTSRVEEMLRTPRITPRLIPVQNKRRAAVNARQSIKLSSSVYYSRHRQRVRTPPFFPSPLPGGLSSTVFVDRRLVMSDDRRDDGSGRSVMRKAEHVSSNSPIAASDEALTEGGGGGRKNCRLD